MEFGELDSMSLLQKSAVQEVCNIGLGHAARAISDMTGKSFNISVPQIDRVPLEQVVRYLGGPEEVLLAVYTPFHGEAEGHLSFLFPWTDAQELWKMVLGTAPESPEDVTELEESAVLEVGNILNGSFLNAIGDMTGLTLHIGCPSAGIEMAQSIISQLVIEAELSDSMALAVETAIFDEGQNTKGYFLFIPSNSGLNTILEKLGVAEAA